MQPETPTRELIEKYRKEFEHKNSAEEEAIIEVFKIFPNNKDYKGVLLKSIVINSVGKPSWRELDYFLHDYGKEQFTKGM